MNLLYKQKPRAFPANGFCVHLFGKCSGAILAWLFFGSLAFSAFAQNSPAAPQRDASFLDSASPTVSTPVFSGLAAAPPALSPPPTLDTTLLNPPPAPQPDAARQEAASSSTPVTGPVAIPVATPAAARAEPPPTALPTPPSAVPVAIPAAPQPAPPSAQTETQPGSPPAASPGNVTIVTPPAVSAPTPVPAPAQTPASPAPSLESIGVPAGDNLGAAMWKGTPRPVAEKLLSMAALTASPTLNDLMQRLLLTSAAPPEGGSDAAQSLTAMRIEKLVSFGDSDAAWSLAKHAEAKLVDDITFHFAAEAELAGDADEICAALPDFAKTRTSVDWRKTVAICALKAKDAKIAQDALNLLSNDANRDDMFIEVANKDVLGDGKSLPHQLTPLTPDMLALLKLTGQPLPGELYGHPDFALVPALLRMVARQDVAQLGLAERAAARGVIGGAALEAVYKAATFPPDELAAPATAAESGTRQRALLFQAALAAKRPADRIDDAVRFVQAAPPELLNGAGGVAGDMLGAVPADIGQAENAVAVARIYMLAGRGDLALDWVRLARRTPSSASALMALWPQLVLAGVESESDYAADFDRWLAASLQFSDPQADTRAQRDAVAAQMLLLDAAGFAVPDAAWAETMVPSHNEKKTSLSPVLLARLEAAGHDGRRAETVLLAAALAGDSEISLPVALAIVRALRGAGLKSEAAIFARQTVAAMAKSNN